MKPTPEQKLWLKNYLNEVMRYRETYEEVYDHVSLAIENEPENEFFETIIANIINRDFGGTDGLYQLEENCKLAVDATVQIQFRDNLKKWFTTSNAIFTVSMFAGLLYLQFSPFKTGIWLFLVFVVLLLLPLVICSARAARLGYKYGENKRSIKDEVFRKMAFTSDRVIWRVTTISFGAQIIANFLFFINDYLDLAAGIFVIFLLIWPHIRKLISKYKNKNSGEDNANLKINLLPFKEKVFYGCLSLMFLAIDLITKFIDRAGHATVQTAKSLPFTAYAAIYSIIATVLVAMVINAFAVIKLYNSEFKSIL